MPARNFSDFFTRASAGWYFNSAGVLTQAAINEPRYDFDPVTKVLRGLLLEEARTNLQVYSQDFTNAAWAKSSVALTQNAAVAPDGTMTMTKVVVSAGISTIANDSNGGVARTPAVAASTTWCWTICAKAAELNLLRLREAVASGLRVLVNLTDGSVVYENGSSGNMAVSTTNVGNGIWRITATRTTAAAETTQRVDIKPGIDTGDGVSGVYIWGAQLEQGTFPTSYIPTLAAQVTRSADQCSLGLGTAWSSPTEGTIYAEFVPALGVDQTLASLALGADGLNSIRLRKPASNQMSLVDRTAGTTYDVVSAAAVSAGVVKAAGAFKAGDQALCFNGGAVATGTGPIPTLTMLHIGGNAGMGANPGNGWLRDLRYYPRRLSNAELQALTL